MNHQAAKAVEETESRKHESMKARTRANRLKPHPAHHGLRSFFVFSLFRAFVMKCLRMPRSHLPTAGGFESHCLGGRLRTCLGCSEDGGYSNGRGWFCRCSSSWFGCYHCIGRWTTRPQWAGAVFSRWESRKVRSIESVSVMTSLPGTDSGAYPATQRYLSWWSWCPAGIRVA